MEHAFRINISVVFSVSSISTVSDRTQKLRELEKDLWENRNRFDGKCIMCVFQSVLLTIVIIDVWCHTTLHHITSHHIILMIQYSFHIYEILHWNSMEKMISFVDWRTIFINRCLLCTWITFQVNILHNFFVVVMLSHWHKNPNRFHIFTAPKKNATIEILKKNKRLTYVRCFFVVCRMIVLGYWMSRSFFFLSDSFPLIFDNRFE